MRACCWNRLRSNQPEFSWLAVVDTRGQVQVATQALLQG